jgi:osmoprotectant transport system permease protein
MTDPRLADAWARLPDYLGSHVLVSATALGLGLAVSLPLGIAAVDRRWLRAGVLGAASVIQTVPGLALLTLFYPLLLALAALSERAFGRSFSALGFLPAVLALAFYSMLPVLRNTVTGLGAISDELRDNARALGLNRRQALWLIELPLALPVIMAGIRTAAVWVIGTATLSTPIGQASLGNYIFAGLQTQNWVFVLFGCVAAAALALVVDQFLALMEQGVATHRHGKIIAGGAGLLVTTLAALLPALSGAHSGYVIGTKPFTEQYVLASLIEQRLQANGLAATQRPGLGSSVIFDALASGDIDAYVDYSGTLWANQMKRTDSVPRDTMLRELDAWLSRRGIVMLGPLGFENAYALVMPHAKAQALGIRSIADLAAHAPRMSIAGDYEFFDRPEWKTLRATYGLQFREQRQMQAEFMYPAAADGQVDVIAGYSSDGQIAKFGLVTLADPKQAIPPYDAVLLVSPKRASDETFLAALKPLVGAISIEAMREANLKASAGGAQGSPAEVARWLSERLGR